MYDKILANRISFQNIKSLSQYFYGLEELRAIEVNISKKKIIIFWLCRPFWYEKGPINTYFYNLFQSPCKIIFKRVVLTWHFIFGLDREKIIFQGNHTSKIGKK